MRIKCKQCDGFYKLREGRFGVFAGCSNYPHCRSTLQLYELAQAFIQAYGLKIYCWERVCWKCGKATPVYSYFLDYELEEVDEFLGSYGPIGLGDLQYVDQILVKEIATIQLRYSKTTRSAYMANTCVHCGALQGRNYVVNDPHEIIEALWHTRAMDKYLCKTIRVEDSTPLLPDLKRIFTAEQ